MKFKQIDINCFKSFPELTSFPIDNGLTGIVGPNGCGKSNVVEALKWVMGETSAKSMRGSGMEDVIFSGTSNRPSKNISEVALFLDNKEKSGPAQYKEFDEISVKRKIEKDKGSKYYINDREVRARDVQTFFADLSTGAHSPSLISQGRIGQLVTAKPIERKSILEEAAGISGIHARRQEAETRLNAAENNLKRADELKKQQQKHTKISPSHFFSDFGCQTGSLGGVLELAFLQFFSALGHLGAQRPQGAAPRAPRPPFLLIFDSFLDRFS